MARRRRSYQSGLITVNNQAPVISSMTRGVTVEGVALSYSAQVSDPNNGDEWTYLWELKKNGTTVATATTPTFSAVPANDGSYSMTLSVTDGEATTTQTQNFSVANVAPVGSIADISGTPIEGSPVNLVASAIDVPADTLTYTWTVGHGGTVYNGTGSTFSFTPTDDGVYVSQVVISDGTTTTTVNKTFNVGNNIPVGHIGLPALTGVTGWGFDLQRRRCQPLHWRCRHRRLGLGQRRHDARPGDQRAASPPLGERRHLHRHGDLQGRRRRLELRDAIVHRERLRHGRRPDG